MSTPQNMTDKLAIGLSALCAIHCLAVPSLLLLLPSLAAMQLENEAFHFWMVLTVVPTSVFALATGCKLHQRFHLVVAGGAGLLLLLVALMLGESLIGEAGEKTLTLVGALLVALSHWANIRLCYAHHHHCAQSDAC
ncbi:MerC domain-containing protein [Aestuariibacter sp. AA17]|uniref:MerC domain-containing protein n=1 Tax=Fluctibacter corallii TaxID=2984329 RepID=A0ABT3A665_9ALTE|nr:MerC domain-containing protein [Aestuariibacter sp. AA17]MCV2884175.1 MerC domain-containing protein [Aestuariibacter sp. AA17]